MNKSRLVLSLSILNLLAFLGTVVVNELATALPINNKTTFSYNSARSKRSSRYDCRLGAYYRRSYSSTGKKKGVLVKIHDNQ